MDGLGKANEHGNDYDNDYESKTKKSQEDMGKGGEIDFWSTNMKSTSHSCFVEKFKISKINGKTILTLVRPSRAPERKS